MIANAENQEKAAREDLAEFMDLFAESLLVAKISVLSS
jgi:hypothetical protein